VVLVVPVADEDGDVAVGAAEGHGDDVAIVDDDAAVAAAGALQAGGREVEEAADLVLDLELVRPVPAGRDGAIGAQHPVLPAVLPVLDPVPALRNRTWYDARSRASSVAFEAKSVRALTTHQVMRSGSSRSLSTLTTTFQLVVMFTTGPGNLPLMPITYRQPARQHQINMLR
jgi:hypothetical protein